MSLNVRGTTPTPLELASRKRKPFQYEKERRIVIIPPQPAQELDDLVAAYREETGDYDPVLVVTELYGYPLPWSPETWIESVLVHPGADFAFRASVDAVVEAFAPSLKDRFQISGMAKKPPKL